MCENYVGTLFLSQHQSMNSITQEKNQCWWKCPQKCLLWLNFYIGQDFWHGPDADHNMAQAFHSYSQNHNSIPQLMNIAIVGGSWGKMLKLGFKTQFQSKRLWLSEICWKFAVFDFAFLIEHIDNFDIVLNELNSINSTYQTNLFQK